MRNSPKIERKESEAVANAMGQNYKSAHYKRILPKCEGQTEHQNNINTAFVTSHGITKSYLHRFKIIESPDCPCGGGSQTIDNLLFDYAILQEVEERLIGKTARQDNWPVNKSQLGNKYIKHFIQFTNTIDFTKL
jgi:hypothetical protein